MHENPMIVGIHQPNFCPWLGYFAKILRCDLFVLLDNAQFVKNGWTNRVRIKTPRGAQWLTVPVLTKGRFGQRIAEVAINDRVKWRKKVIKSLEANYARADYFKTHFPEIAEAISEASPNLCELNVTLIEKITRVLDLDVRFVRGTSLQSTGQKTDLLISIVKAVGGSTYLSGDGAAGYLEEDKFRSTGIRFERNNFHHPVYPQLWGDFVPGLSILDALFNLGADGTRQLLLDELAAKEPAHRALLRGSRQ